MASDHTRTVRSGHTLMAESGPWAGVVEELDQKGFAVTRRPLLSERDAAALRRGFDRDADFRNTVEMARHNFGQGRYRYYANPVPSVIANLRAVAYGQLVGLANEWSSRLGEEPFPGSIDDFVESCATRGQTQPTPLILRYGVGGWNALHQDLYGEVYFPFQMAVALSRPGADFSGGENLFVLQRPRSQSRGSAVAVPYRHGVVFATNHLPILGTRGYYRAVMRHGVSTVTSGERTVLGIIFHNAS